MKLVLRNIKSRTASFATSATLAVISLTAFGISSNASAESAVEKGAEAVHAPGMPTTLFGDYGIVSDVTNTLLFITGALAVIMIIWGGIRYAISGGNSNSVTAAKNTILYAIVGLIIAFLSFAAVNWILSILSGDGTGYSTR